MLLPFTMDGTGTLKAKQKLAMCYDTWVYTSPSKPDNQAYPQAVLHSTKNNTKNRSFCRTTSQWTLLSAKVWRPYLWRSRFAQDIPICDCIWEEQIECPPTVIAPAPHFTGHCACHCTLCLHIKF